MIKKITTTSFEEIEEELLTKWEYLIVNAGEHDFDGLGQIGSELVAVDQGIAYFKRRVIE